MVKSRKTLEKLAINDPTEPHTATRDKSTADSILSSNTFFWGGDSCISFHFLSCPLLFSLVCPPLVTDVVFSFSFCCLFSGSKEKEEKKNEWKKHEKGREKQNGDKNKK